MDISVAIVFLIIAIIIQEIQIIDLHKGLAEIAKVHNKLAELVYQKLVYPSVEQNEAKEKEEEADQ